MRFVKVSESHAAEKAKKPPNAQATNAEASVPETDYETVRVRRSSRAEVERTDSGGHKERSYGQTEGKQRVGRSRKNNVSKRERDQGLNPTQL